jgi:hypothetical protein
LRSCANGSKEGAVYRPHWAFEKPARPALPAIAQQDGWVRTPIDAFILARMKKEGLHPSPEADKDTLIRRVTLDLTGLLPTPAEVKAFEKDTSPQAYEHLVDGCWRGQPMAKHGRGTGWTTRATPIPMGCTTTTAATSGPIATT